MVVLPARSRAVTEKLCAPSASRLVGTVDPFACVPAQDVMPEPLSAQLNAARTGASSVPMLL